MSEEPSTDVHTVKKQRRKEVAMQVGIPTAVLTTVLGGGGYLLRNHDMDRIESRQDKVEEQVRQSAASIIEIRADSRNQGEKIDRIDRGVDALNGKVDSIRDRLPR